MRLLLLILFAQYSVFIYAQDSSRRKVHIEVYGAKAASSHVFSNNENFLFKKEIDGFQTQQNLDLAKDSELVDLDGESYSGYGYSSIIDDFYSSQVGVRVILPFHFKANHNRNYWHLDFHYIQNLYNKYYKSSPIVRGYNGDKYIHSTRQFQFYDGYSKDSILITRWRGNGADDTIALLSLPRIVHGQIHTEKQAYSINAGYRFYLTKPEVNRWNISLSGQVGLVWIKSKNLYLNTSLFPYEALSNYNLAVIDRIIMENGEDVTWLNKPINTEQHYELSSNRVYGLNAELAVQFDFRILRTDPTYLGFIISTGTQEMRVNGNNYFIRKNLNFGLVAGINIAEL